MSKSTAKSKPPPSKAAKKPASVSKPVAKTPAQAKAKAAPAKPLAKLVPKSAPKSAPKPPSKAAKPTPASAKKAAPAPVGKVAAKTATSVGKPNVGAAKAAPPPSSKASPKAAARDTPQRSMPSSSKSLPKPSPQPAAPAPVKPLSQARTAAAAGKAAAAAAAATAAAAASAAAASAASASRFADRFAPAKPAARTVADHSLDVHKPAAKADPKLAGAWKHKAGRELSEPELLAMPESEYMNEKQLDFFRTRLVALKDDLLSNAGETTEHLREDTSIVPDPADRATIEEEHALELRTRDRERKLLKKISQSIGRIENGEYGYCDETGEPIGLGRLLARPTATLSLEAQQRRELKQKMFGD